MKAKVVIDGMIVELEGTVEDIKEFLKKTPKSKQQPHDPNQKYGPITPNIEPVKTSGKEFEDVLKEIHKAIREAKDEKIYNPYWPSYPYRFTYKYCTCPTNGWWSITPPPPCPIHGHWEYYTITCTSNSTDKIQYANYPQNSISIGGSSGASFGTYDNIITSAWEVKNPTTNVLG